MRPFWRALAVSAGVHAAVLGAAWQAGWRLPSGGGGGADAGPWGGEILLPVLPSVAEPGLPALPDAAEEGPGEEPPEPIRETLSIPSVLRGSRGGSPQGPEAGHPPVLGRGPPGPPGAGDPGPCPAPPYPEEALRLGVEGTVQVRVEVLADGRVGKVRLLASSGSPALDAVVLDWIPRRWGPFQPMRDALGRPIPGQSFDRPIRFSISGR